MSMRITNNMMIDKFVFNMQNNLQKTDKYTSQLSTGRKIVRLSDDPVGVYSALTARQRLSRYEQYQKNLDTALSWVDQCDSSLQQISSILQRVREEDINAATNVKTAGDRINISKLMIELKGAIKDALNANVGNQYIFAGYNTLNAPITEGQKRDANGDPVVDANGNPVMITLYNGLDLTDLSEPNATNIQNEKDQIFSLELGYGVHEPVAMTAIDVLGTGEDNLFKVIDDIISLMEGKGTEDLDDPTAQEVVMELSALLEKISVAHTNVSSCLVKVGAMSANMEMLNNRYSQDVITYNEVRSEIEDVDSAEAIMDWKMVEAVYKQSLAVGARIIQPTLMDFLN